MDVEVTSIVNGEITVNIPLGIVTAAPPFRENVAAIVRRSPSSSTKFEDKGILLLFPWTSETAAGTIATLGAEFVILNLKLVTKLEGKPSDTVILIT
jgi:hypothetical protein